MRRATARWLLGGLFAAVVVLVVLTLLGLRDSGEPATAARAKASPGSSDVDPAAPASRGAESPPWHATPEPSTALPPGTVPAWKVAPPPPDPSAPLPPPPVEPPNPATHRPPMDNPGGVNGDRPERTP